jgi:hypothetical protein
MTDDAALERDLRAMLAARDPGPAQATLVTAIRTQLAEDRAPTRLIRSARSAASAAGLVAIAAAIIFALVVARPVVIGPGSTPPPEAVVPYVLKAGDGLADPLFVPFFQAIAWLAVLIGLAIMAFRSHRRFVTISATLAIVGWVWVGANAGTSDALTIGGGTWALNPSSSQQPDEPGEFLGVDGDQPFHVILTVTNASRLPLELRGLAPSDNRELSDPPMVPGFVALGSFPTRDIVMEQVRPFAPVTVPPDGSVDLVLLGMAGSCALSVPPPGRTGGGFTSLESIDLVYEQLTIVHTERLPLEERINVWWPDPCG